jgi:hypothetical protein
VPLEVPKEVIKELVVVVALADIEPAHYQLPLLVIP